MSYWPKNNFDYYGDDPVDREKKVQIRGKFNVGDCVKNKYSGAKGKIECILVKYTNIIYVVKWEKYNPSEELEETLEACSCGDSCNM